MSRNLVLQEGIGYDRRSFKLNGRRIFVNSAAIHYFRMPKEEWRDVLMKAKLAGMNCVDTYFAWNVHEPREGEWDFGGDRDCGAFLDLCAELGLWVIARPGPYICAEWDFGGFPWWLRQKDGIRYRANDRTFLKYVDQYFDRLIPIIRERQHSRGGNVILVQVENEYGYLHDDEAARDYMAYLRDGLISRGIDVPLITCVGSVEGTIEGANFWSHADEHYAKLTEKQPDLPKIVTEFWTGWFEHWGAPAATQKTADLYERRQMEALRAGFTGISHYMFFGGTNFGGYGGRTVGSSDIFMVTSYDYDAPLNEYGRITDKYLAAKKVSLFTQAIHEFLLESEEISAGDAGTARATTGLQLRGRQRGNERLWFAESLQEERENFHVTLGSGRTVPIMVKPGQIVPILDRIELWSGLLLTCNTFIAGNEEIGSVHTVIISADNGQRSYVELESREVIHWGQERPGNMRYKKSQDGRRITFDFFHFEQPQIIDLRIGGRPLRLIVMNRTLSDETWRVECDHGVCWAIGYKELDVAPSGEVWVVRGMLPMKPLLLGSWETLGLPSVRGEAGEPFASLKILDDSLAQQAQEVQQAQQWQQTQQIEQARQVKQAESSKLEVPQLASWKSTPLDLSSLTGARVDQPQGFSEFSQPFGYLVYECHIESAQEGTPQLILPAIQDTARVFLNGRQQALISEVGAAAVELRIPAGSSKLQILVQHMGSLNFSPYLGESKGISGPVYMDGNKQDLRRNWRVIRDTDSSTNSSMNSSMNFSMDSRTNSSMGSRTNSSMGSSMNPSEVSSHDFNAEVTADMKEIHLDEVLDEVSIWGDQPPLLRRTFSQGDYDKAVLVGAISDRLLINGQEVDMPEYQEWFAFHTVDISDYIIQGENTIEMRGAKAPLNRLELLSYRSSALLQDWKMSVIHAPVAYQSSNNLEQLDPNRFDPDRLKSEPFNPEPTWYSSTFPMPLVPSNRKPRLKLRLSGMSKGTIWLNGIDLGRYWQIGPQEDYKLPMAWLRKENELILFDEEGRSPIEVQLLYDDDSKDCWYRLGDDRTAE